jgi:DNA-binding transcriptional ArsR family regulator
MKDADRSLLKMMERPAARRGGPSTSRKAAAQVRRGSVRSAILKTLESASLGGLKPHHCLGMATFEIAEQMGVPRDYISPHMQPLKELGYVYKTGAEVENPATRNKVKSEVWKATERGLQRARQLPAIGQPGGWRRRTAEAIPGDVVASSKDPVRHILEHPRWPDGLEAMRNYEREGDMGDNGVLRVYVDDQGDVYVSTHVAHSVRFCTKVGGGRSPRTRAAVLYLARAIQLDKKERP